MKTVFADSSYYFALLSRRDAAHVRAVQFARSYAGRLVTHQWILTEVADGLAAPKNRHGFVKLLQELKKDRSLTMVPATSNLFERGCELYEQRPDKSWSLTDCISFVVMEDHGITEALTADHHFEQAGFVALLK